MLNSHETVKIDNVHGYHRDMRSHAVININNAEYESYMRQKKLIEDANIAATEQAGMIKAMQYEMVELKRMMAQLINGESNGSST